MIIIFSLWKINIKNKISISLSFSLLSFLSEVVQTLKKKSHFWTKELGDKLYLCLYFLPIMSGFSYAAIIKNILREIYNHLIKPSFNSVNEYCIWFKNFNKCHLMLKLSVWLEQSLFNHCKYHLRCYNLYFSVCFKCFSC